MAGEARQPRGFRFGWWMAPAGLGGLVLVVIAVGAIILATRDVADFKDLITAELSRETGREVRIKGDLDLSVGFSPSIVAEDISIANASWGSRPDMLTARRLEVKVALFPMLGGTVETKRLVIDGADVLLETDAKGASNWPFSSEPSSGTPDSELLAADSLEIRDSLLTLKDGRRGQSRTIKIDGATGGVEPASNRLAFEGTGAFNQLPLRAKAMIGRRGPKAPLMLELKVGKASLTLDGTIERPADLEGLDVAATLSAESLTALGALAGGSALPSAAGPVTIRGRLSGGGDTYALDQIDGTLGATKLTGALKLVLGGEAPRLSGALDANAIDLDLFLGETRQAETPRGGRLFGDEPIEVAWLEDADIELALAAKTADYRGTRLSDLKTILIVRDRMASLKPLVFKLAGGALDGEARLDGTGKAPALTFRATMRGVDLDQALKLLEIDETGQGKLDIDADLRAIGGSPRALAASLAGRLDIAMGRGRIDNGLVDLLAADLVQRLMPWNVSENYSNVNCMVARFPIERGVMRAERLLLDTTKMTMGGDGTIDLGRETINLRLVPKPKDPALLSLAVPVLVEGPLDHPSAGPDTEAVALGVAGSALGTLINPLGILIPFVSGGGGGENPCVAALRKGAPAAKPGAAEAKAKEKPSKGAVESVVEGVGEGLGSIGKGIGSIFE